MGQAGQTPMVEAVHTGQPQPMLALTATRRARLLLCGKSICIRAYVYNAGAKPDSVGNDEHLQRVGFRTATTPCRCICYQDRKPLSGCAHHCEHCGHTANTPRSHACTALTLRTITMRLGPATLVCAQRAKSLLGNSSPQVRIRGHSAGMDKPSGW